jgi:hypothetical protein
MKGTRFKKFCIFGSFGFLILILGLWLATPSYVNVPVGDRVGTRLKLPGVFAQFHNCTYTITYPTDKGEGKGIILRGDFIDAKPILFLSPNNTNYVLCLYDCDSCVQLIRIDLNRSFAPITPNTPLAWLVSNSSCLIESAGREDWEKLRVYFKEPAKANAKAKWLPVLNFGFARIYPSKQLTASNVENQFTVTYGPGPRFY